MSGRPREFAWRRGGRRVQFSQRIAMVAGLLVLVSAAPFARADRTPTEQQNLELYERLIAAENGGDFDQLTGASVTPRAVVKAVRDTLIYFNARREEIFLLPATEDDA